MNLWKAVLRDGLDADYGRNVNMIAQAGQIANSGVTTLTMAHSLNDAGFAP